MDSKGATKSSEPIIDAIRHSAVVMASATAGSCLSFNLAATFKKGTVPSAAIAFRILGAEMRHCNA